ncbi:hypothetical protein SPSIL_035070 [Sporomusa silvacetica DSM 10669]|uniref:Uncharacterized protein n=1 Tax=Sporomusa silvacetica DSM 10669 TaxID=1123289 RepID=A0ABZ3INR3_9FIRM|nr:hypothetical protein [Sporomusa silvacetica]OZC19243.1 hypothetical protein SPSIL_21980 [Sporomusa silvacetica DSM 10669]
MPLLKYKLSILRLGAIEGVSQRLFPDYEIRIEFLSNSYNRKQVTIRKKAFPHDRTIVRK